MPVTWAAIAPNTPNPRRQPIGKESSLSSWRALGAHPRFRAGMKVIEPSKRSSAHKNTTDGFSQVFVTYTYC